MTLKEILKAAWSIPPGERPPGDFLGEYVTDRNIYYLYGPDEEGEYRYRTATDSYYQEFYKKKKRKEADDVINIYIDTDMKGLKGNAHYGYYLEWKRPDMPIRTREGFGTMKKTTRNRLFLHAAKEALERITKAEEVHVYAPCSYMTESANKGMPDIWCLHSWIKGDENEVKNRDLWEQMLPKLKELKPKWHDGNHAYSEVIQMKLKEMQNETTRNRVDSDETGPAWANGTSPYHF